MNDRLLERGLPSNTEAERSILGAILLDNALCNQAIELMKRDDFFLDSHRRIFDKMVGLSERAMPIDLITLGNELRRAGEFEQIGGATYIASLIDGVPRTDTIEPYAEIVRSLAALRRMLAISEELTARIYQGDDARNITTWATSELFEIQSRAGKGVSNTDTMSAADLLAKKFTVGNGAVPGLIAEGANMLAGKPKVGKSWFALQVALAVTRGEALFNFKTRQGEVLYLALEDGARRLQDRLKVLLRSDPPPVGLYISTRWQTLDRGALQDFRAWLVEHPTTRLIVIDTLKRVRPSENNRASTLYALDYDSVAPLADLGKQYGLSVLVVHHLRKAVADDPIDLVSGTLGLAGGVDNVLVLQRARGAADASLFISGRDQAEQQLALNWNVSSSSWTLLGDFATYQQTAQRLAIRTTVEEFTPSPVSPKVVAETLGAKYENVRALMPKMARDGQLRALARGLYTV